MKFKPFVSFFYFFLISLSLHGQNKWSISGTVEAEGEGLPFATVYALETPPDSSRILAFSTTNDQGHFSLDIDESIEEVRLICSFLGYQKVEIKIDQKTVFPLAIEMQRRSNELEEILVIEDQLPISTKGDTVVYQVEDFRDSTEQTIEDVLRKMPGISVEENGQIKVNGEAIGKLMIEGTDMFGRRYTIGSKNLRADHIQAVEVIDNYQDNQVIKNIIDSEEVVLNLKLREDVKNILSGTLIGGIGYGEELKFKLSANIFSIGKKHKLLFISDDGNTGQQFGTEELSATFSHNGFNDLETPIQSPPVFTEPVQSNFLNFKRNYLDNSLSSFNTLRNYFDFTPSLKAKINILYATKQDEQYSLQQTRFLYQENVFDNDYAQQLNHQNVIAQANLNLNYLNPQNTQSFDFILDFNSINHESEVQKNFNQQVTPAEIVSTRKLNQKVFLLGGLYTWKFTEQRFIYLKSKNSYSFAPENFTANNPDIPLLFSIQDSLQAADQQLEFHNQLHEFSLGIAQKMKSLFLQAEYKFMVSKFDFSNTLALIGASNGDNLYQSHHQLKSEEDYFSVASISAKKQFSSSGDLTIEFSSAYRDVKTNIQNHRFSLAESISTRISYHKEYLNKLQFRFAYQFRNDPLANYDFISTSYFKSDLSYHQSVFKTKLPSGHLFLFRLAKNNYLKLDHWQVSANFSFKKSLWIDDYRFLGNLTYSTPVFSKNNFYGSLFSKWERFIPGVKTNIEIQPVVSYNSFQLSREGAFFNSSLTKGFLSVVVARKFFRRLLFNLKSSLSASQYATDESTNKLTFYQYKINPFISLNLGRWKINSALHYYQSGGNQQKLSLLGTQFKIERPLKIKNWETDWGLEINNWLNQKRYNSLTTSNYFTSIQSIEAIPPFFVFSFNHSL